MHAPADDFPTTAASVSIRQLIGGRSAAVRSSGLVIAPRMSFSRWEQIGQEIFTLSNASTWWIADWLVYGETAFEDRYREAIKKTALSYQTLRNYAWVARRFEMSRRRDNLTFGHHAETAALEMHEQDYWLRKTEELGWSRNDLRRELRASLRERGETSRADGDLASKGRDASASRDQLLLELTLDQVERFTRIANALGVELEDWALRVLETAAIQSQVNFEI